MAVEYWIVMCVILMVSPGKGYPKPRAGLLDMFTGENQDEGRSVQQNFPSIIPNNFHLLNHNSDYDDGNQQPNTNNQQPNINLVSLFPQNNVPGTRSGLDPETRETLSEQKEKLEDILQKLQELNKQKEEQRQQQGNGNNGFNNFNPNLNKPNKGNNIFNRPTQNPLRPGTTTEKVVATERPAVVPKKVWKKLMTKKFMFQAKPVKPENEAESSLPNTLYYVVE